MPTIPANPSAYALQTALGTALAPDSSVPFAHPFVDGMPWTTLSLSLTFYSTLLSTPLQTVVSYPTPHFQATHATFTRYPRTTLLNLPLMFP